MSDSAESHKVTMNLRFVERQDAESGRKLRILQQMYSPIDWKLHDIFWVDVPVHVEEAG